jgi:Cu-Zn family superoxide dismutase
VRRLVIATGVAVALGGCATPPAPPPAAPAAATLKDKDGREVGRATFVEVPEGVRIAVAGRGLPPGPKALEIHVNGVCQPPLFTSVGPRRPRTETLPNLLVNEGGEGSVDFVEKRMTLSPGSRSLFGENGASLVVLSGPHAMQADPLGTGGSRLACGVITPE